MKLRSGKIVGNSWSAPDRKRKALIIPSLPEELQDRKRKALIIPSSPEELQERILATLPFQQILQMWILSKLWHGKLSSSQDDEEKRFVAASFQRLAFERSDTWRISCPIFLSSDFFITYEATQDWRKMPTLSFLPEEAATKVRGYFLTHKLFNPLMVRAILSITTSLEDIVYVINIFTTSLKELPALPPYMENGWYGTAKWLVSCKDTYKAIRLFTNVGYVCAWIYESKFVGWSCKRIAVKEEFQVGFYDVHLNGIIYVPLHVGTLLLGFLALHVKDETFELLEMPQIAVLSEGFMDDLGALHLVVCYGTVFSRA